MRAGAKSASRPDAPAASDAASDAAPKRRGRPGAPVRGGRDADVVLDFEAALHAVQILRPRGTRRVRRPRGRPGEAQAPRATGVAGAMKGASRRGGPAHARQGACREGVEEGVLDAGELLLEEQLEGRGLEDAPDGRVGHQHARRPRVELANVCVATPFLTLP